ncbi:hypothetical protein KOR34_04970 [Posidoniimonas corsicana]|uniref:Uncharacterized protein n=1 Tax=Posidoniimonas corsicana TaxID=1938618 RepID=A0A5C5VAI0_9BACT|nr:hypothetical protein [Posidoniimonas corsicana]TWT35604.1 hypothetical protein KOR34_04970 [Posidoniimonas corsicana]
MAKKNAIPAPMTGIYTKRRRELTPAQWRSYSDALNAPAESYVRDLQSRFVDAAMPHLVPIDGDPLMVVSGATPPPAGCTDRVEILAPGEAYAVQESAPPAFDHAMEGLRLCENLLRALQRDDRGGIVQNAVAVGRAIERLAILPLEPFVIEGHKRKVVQTASMRAKKGSVSERNKSEALRAIAREQQRHYVRRHDIDFIKEMAAQKLGISKRALNMRLKK